MSSGMEAGSCYCDYGDSDLPEFYSETIRKARKRHKCCECGAEIKRGERYHDTTGKWDGEFMAFLTCLPCARIRRDFAPCSCFGELRNDLSEKLGFDYITGEWDIEEGIDDE